MDTARVADPDPTLKKNTDPTSKENVATDPTDWRIEFANPAFGSYRSSKVDTAKVADPNPTLKKNMDPDPTLENMRIRFRLRENWTPGSDFLENVNPYPDPLDL